MTKQKQTLASKVETIITESGQTLYKIQYRKKKSHLNNQSMQNREEAQEAKDKREKERTMVKGNRGNRIENHHYEATADEFNASASTFPEAYTHDGETYLQ